ncbi:hypothetical protein [Oricola indica]|uniref:hypothetical protein n=1 Tax=Oricola indica TaxID=2872591 RepID=UPI003CCB7651
MNRSEIKTNYDGLSQMFESHHKTHFGWINYDVVERDSFLIHMTFNQSIGYWNINEYNHIDYRRGVYHNQIFRKFYFDLCRDILGPNFHRPSKHKLQPLCFAFIDAEESRCRFDFNKDNLTNLHIHAILTPHYEHRDALQEYTTFEKQIRIRQKYPEIDSLKIEPFNKDRASFGRALSYCGKLFARHAGADLDIDGLSIYPEYLHDRKQGVSGLFAKNCMSVNPNPRSL